MCLNCAMPYACKFVHDEIYLRFFFSRNKRKWKCDSQNIFGKNEECWKCNNHFPQLEDVYQKN